MDYDALFKKRDAAARRIQAAWRAYRGRKGFLRLRDAANRIQAVAKGWYVRKQVHEQRGRQHLEQRFQTIMEKHQEKMRILEAEKRALLALPGSEMEEYEQRRVMAAIKVQAHWRGLVARRKLARSPERTRREQAARRIQAAFRNVLRSRRSVNALLASVAVDSSLPVAVAVAAPGARMLSPGALRQSGTSVLLGSPPMQSSPESPGGRRGPGGGGGGGGEATASRRTSPQKQRPASRGGGGGVAAAEGVQRNASVIGPRRYKELQAQVEGKLGAYMALARSRGSRRPDPRVADACVAQLLREYHRTAPERLGAVAERQRNLVAMDTLCGQLEQVRPLADLPPDAAPQDFPRAARGSERAERAAQAHALALAEAKVGNSWWTHLRALNTQAVQSALLAEDEERWEDLDARWRRKWREVEEQENRRPDPQELLEEALRCQTRGPGAAAVAAARQAAAMQSKQEEYAERIARAAVAVPVGAPERLASSGQSPE